MPNTFILTLSCPERPGIVHAVTAFLFGHGCDIVEHRQFDDPIRHALFLRTEFVARGDTDTDATQLSAAFRSEVADEFAMDFQLADDKPQRVLVMVSKMGHCLNDLIFRWRAGSLHADLVAVVSNHEDLRPMAEAGGLPFIHVPVTPESKPQAEQRLLELVDEYGADLVVLARYMQVLSDNLCLKLLGRAINIHHSFLPGFKGAKPYHQAFDRGVKLVGATAHYVTPDLDEGPIIEQEVIRIDHNYDPRALTIVGRDAEAIALARAVRWHSERRVLLNERSTVVFR
ncbi:formyltetrahydrofolate deformylase [Pseudonocardia charpentierae]|uniref:Formyltetrahydrofolate deformylase n=1 Tax=Pseudonocardia charpentierae TaxID=3075545 RepID=A0ABU2NFE0_9PSEU|nr:formyltetrahydrofolate deformylase [Pseudonocardia sp. DSM 45834]MDT0352683.1 formyltetrahydrofolate deformylase [Pseudonocardia sp. DSM 45834]